MSAQEIAAAELLLTTVRAQQFGALLVEFRRLFKEYLLASSGETKFPTIKSFSQNKNVRIPEFWLALIEERQYEAKDFTTIDDVDGPATIDFSKCVERSFSGLQSAPYVLPADQKQDAAELVRLFRSVGTMYSHIPVNPRETAEDLVQVIHRVCSPQIEDAYKIIRRMISRLIDARGCSGDRYLTEKILDPTQFSERDKDALKRATTRAEVPFDKRARDDGGKDVGKEETCSVCNKKFTGSWSKHKKSGSCN